MISNAKFFDDLFILIHETVEQVKVPADTRIAPLKFGIDTVNDVIQFDESHFKLDITHWTRSESSAGSLEVYVRFDNVLNGCIYTTFYTYPGTDDMIDEFIVIKFIDDRYEKLLKLKLKHS